MEGIIDRMSSLRRKKGCDLVNRSMGSALDKTRSPQPPSQHNEGKDGCAYRSICRFGERIFSEGFYLLCQMREKVIG